ncbi:MAG: molybdopterin cofactor-binding domain-containing protein, partial [Pseudomonadota bacterium]
MASIGKIARRTFLIGSAAIAGGVAFGFYAANRDLQNPLLAGLKPGEAAITPFVKITADGITLITPRADKGQGAYSLQAMLIAEELDVDPQKVTLSPGEPAPAYFNGAVLAEASPFAAYDESWIAERVRGLMAVPAKLVGLQMTGGSSTVPDMFDRLREAGAVARETLKKAASDIHQVPVDGLSTRDGAVILPDGSSVPYTALADAASRIEPVQEVTLRSSDEWRLIGKPFRRTDSVAKSTGTQTYGIDLSFDGMLYATVKANPGLGARVLSFDASVAETMRGVKKIVAIENGVAVIADNTWRAFQAADALQIEWGTPDYPAHTQSMWEVLDACHSDDFIDSRKRNDGDVETVLAEGGLIEAEYRVPYLAHAPLEPMNAVARFSDERLDIWTGTQIPRFIQDHAAALSGLPADKVHVHNLPIGGSFGRRLEDTYVLQAVEIAMAVPETPIKLTWSREEDMAHDYPRPMALARARGKAGNGAIDAFDLDIISQSVAASWFGRLWFAPPGPDVTLVAGAWDQPFALPNYRVTGFRAIEMVPVSSWRSVGASGNAFFHECFMDELIAEAGVDPLEARLKLCSHDLSRNVLEAVGELSDWNGPTISKTRARGLAFTLSFGVPVAEVVEISVTDEGIRIDKVFVACEVGRIVDPVNFEAQVTGSVIWGLGHAMNCELTYENHVPVQTNYDAYEGMRLYQAPD